MTKQPNFAASSLGFAGMLLPLLYFGGLIYYFSRVGGGSLDGVIGVGLGPTVLGLGALGLVFAIKPLYLIFRFVIGMTTGRGTTEAIVAAGRNAGDPPVTADFDADATIARYLANRATGEAEVSAPMAANPSAAARPGFGRKQT